MQLEGNLHDFYILLQRQLTDVERLQEVFYDDPVYDKWRAKTGQILDQIFGQSQTEQHPCTRAFLKYKIPEHFTATREEMQEYYQNILRYQADLLRTYLDDIENWEGLSRIPTTI